MAGLYGEVVCEMRNLLCVLGSAHEMNKPARYCMTVANASTKLPVREALKYYI